MFSVAAPKLWNNLHLDIRQIDSVYVLKSTIVDKINCLNETTVEASIFHRSTPFPPLQRCRVGKG